MVVYQIYFQDQQKKLLEPEFIPYKNEDCTIFFENSVIKDLVDQGHHKRSEYFGVVSYNLRYKLGLRSRNVEEVVRNRNAKDFDFSNLQMQGDVMAISNIIGHDTVTNAQRYHPNFIKLFERVTDAIGIKWRPTIFEVPIYWNFFIAREEIYEEYVKYLTRAMEVMYDMKELYENANYHKPLPKDLQEKFMLPHYPYHTFICERLPNWFFHINKIKCHHLK